MSLYDFKKATDLRSQDVPFYALIMAAMMKADSINAQILQKAWPELWAETEERYNAPGGLLGGEGAPKQAEENLQERV